MSDNKLIILKNMVKHFPVKAGGFASSKEYVHAVNNVSFTLARKQTLGLVGESGCGKTTTARTILKVLEPDGGRLYFNQSDEKIKQLDEIEQLWQKQTGPKKNKDLKRQFLELKKETDFFSYPRKKFRQEQLKMRYIFQDPYLSLNPKMHVNDIITESLIENKLISRKDKNKTAKKYLDIVGISGNALFKFPHEFSGGQRQRINIARAIASNPDFIICDEPVSSLDVSIQSQVLNLLIQIQKELNISFLFIAHNLAVVFYMSDYVAVMYTGKIVEYAPSRELYENPLHPYTKLLMSVVPELGKKKNIFDIKIKSEVPSLINLPKGCTFYNRCPIREDICLSEFPHLDCKVPGHFCACYEV